MTFMSRRSTLLLVVLMLGMGLLAACIQVPSVAPEAVPAVVTAQEIAVAPEPTASPTATVEAPVPTPTRTTTAPTRTPQVKSAAATTTPTRAAAKATTKAPAKAVTPTATIDRHRVVFTEADIAKAVAAGAGRQQGVTIQNLKVRFADGKIRITADRLGSGLIQLRNFDLVGRLVANNGVLSLQVESISPRGLAANIIPTMANQALAQYASQWYVEDVKTLDGRVELRIR